MRFILLGLILGTIQYSFSSEVVQKHQQKICEGESECSIFLRQLKIEKTSGVCTGKLTEEMSCKVSYLVSSSTTVVNVVCDENEEQVIDQELMVETQRYQVGAITDQGIKIDPAKYLLLGNEFINLLVSQNGDKKDHNITLRLGLEGDLSDLKCD